ncbi:hypothetical protein [Paramagnetospirillum magneticum]|uniref:hypothetical protein n=1 Tax=Paramagnetospirillum magneticum TaxID=84159 RepID=UPI0011D077E3|nr:hypothetical protein [Paramagnetospirillum magneticum]
MPTDDPDSLEAIPPDLIERMRAVCTESVQLLGVDGAERTWKELIKVHKKGRGRPPKENLSKWENILLALYDSLAKDDSAPEELPAFLGRRMMARFTNEERPKEFHSESAIEKRLRRLLRERSEGRLVLENCSKNKPLYRRIRGQ